MLSFGLYFTSSKVEAARIQLNVTMDEQWNLKEEGQWNLKEEGQWNLKEEEQQKVKQERQKQSDAEQLAKALDYFTSQKYHECLLILQSLNEHYKLNPRYKAYLGVCYYYEWDYERTISLLDEAIPQLQAFAPQERSLYYWMDAESHFYLQRYQEAMPLYEEMLKLCHENERPDAYYRLGFCHLFQDDKVQAKVCMEQALEGYLKYRNTPDEKARIAQIRNMIKGLE